MGVKITEISVWSTNPLRNVTVLTNFSKGLTVELQKCQYRWLYWVAMPVRHVMGKGMGKMTACLWEIYKGKTLWTKNFDGAQHVTHRWKFSLRLRYLQIYCQYKVFLDAGGLTPVCNKWPFFHHYSDCNMKSEILNKFCHSTGYLINMAFYPYRNHQELARRLFCNGDHLLTGTK